MDYKGLTVLIPSRNRPKTAINSIKSIIDYIETCNITILISDNSSDNDGVRELKEYYDSLNNPNIKYIRPEREMTFCDHWEWLFSNGMKLFNTNHFTVLADRTVFRKNALPALVEKIKEFPDDLISFLPDAVFDLKYPIINYQATCTEKVIRMDSFYCLEKASKCEYLQSLPTPMRAVMPISILQKIKKEFGILFDSHTPDFEFCFKALAILDNFIYYDKGISIQYAMTTGQGAPSCIGIVGKAAKDVLYAYGIDTPEQFYEDYVFVPELLCPINSIAKEYVIVQRYLNSSKLPPLDKEGYLDALFKSTIPFVNQSDKNYYYKHLKKQGFKIKKTIKVHEYLKNPKMLGKDLKSCFNTHFKSEKTNFTLQDIPLEDSLKGLEFMNNNPRLPVQMTDTVKVLLENNCKILS